MSEENKLRKARELVELTGSGRRMNFGASRSEEFRALQEEHERKLTDLNVALRAKHMSEEQLDALLDFYRSDMGRSILETNRIIGAEFRDRFHEAVSISRPGKDGAAWIADSTGNPDKRDT